MMPVGRSNENRKSAAKRKEDVSEKIKEIKQRQQNWMVQREQSKSKESNNNKSESTTSYKSISGSTASSKTSAPSYKPTIQSYNPASTDHKKKKVTETFQNWRKAQENKDSSEDHDTTSIQSDAESELERLVSPDFDNIKEPVAEEEFGSLADKIASRVKHNMGLAAQESYSDTSLGQTSLGATLSLGSRTSSSRCQTFVKNASAFQHSEDSSLASHKCLICQTVMVTTDHTPLMIIPCGHTLCKTCSERKTNCPECKCTIVSLTVNIMLQQVIEEYHNQSHKLRSSSAQTSMQKNGSEVKLSSTKSSKDITEDSWKNKSGSYQSQLYNLHTRQSVLSDEHCALGEKLVKLNKQIHQASSQTQSIANQEHEIKKAIVDLQDKLEALESHREQYEVQLTELDDEKSETEGKVTLLSGTLASLTREIEKVQLLAEGEQNFVVK